MFNQKFTLLFLGLLFTQFTFAQWTALSSGTTADLYAIDFLNATHGVAVGNNSTILLTTDGGSSWTAANTGEIKADFRSVLMISTDTILAGAGTIFEGNLYRSTNGGQDWESLIEVPQIAASSMGTLAFDNETTYFSQDKGSSWDTTDLEIGNTVLMEDLQFANADTGLLTGNISGFTTYSFYGFRTVNGGTEWAPLWVFDLPNNNARTSLATPHPDTTYLFNNRFVNFLPGEENQLVRLTDFYFDDGQERNSWRFSAEIINADLPAMMISSLFLNATQGFAGSVDGDLYETVDGGKNWTIAYDGDTSLFEIIREDNELLYAVGGNGLILKYNLNTDVGEPFTITPIKVFPNPTRASILVRDFPQAGGQGWLHSLNGQLIRTFDWTNDQSIDVRDLPAGAYLLQLRSAREVYQARFVKQ